MNQHEPTHRPLYSLGDVVITPGARAAFATSRDIISRYLAMHQSGQWGTLDPHDGRANEVAIQVGARLLSAYHLPDGTTIWIMTEADRGSTCVLLGDEYEGNLSVERLNVDTVRRARGAVLAPYLIRLRFLLGYRT